MTSENIEFRLELDANYRALSKKFEVFTLTPALSE